MNKIEIKSHKILLTCLSEENLLRILIGADQDPSKPQEGLIEVDLIDEISDTYATARIRADSIDLGVDQAGTS